MSKDKKYGAWEKVRDFAIGGGVTFIIYLVVKLHWTH